MRTLVSRNPRRWKKRWASRLSLVVMAQIFRQPLAASHLDDLFQQHGPHPHELAQAVDGHQLALVAVKAIGGQPHPLDPHRGDETGQLVRIVDLVPGDDEIAPRRAVPCAP